MIYIENRCLAVSAKTVYIVQFFTKPIPVGTRSYKLPFRVSWASVQKHAKERILIARFTSGNFNFILLKIWTPGLCSCLPFGSDLVNKKSEHKNIANMCQQPNMNITKNSHNLGTSIHGYFSIWATGKTRGHLVGSFKAGTVLGLLSYFSILLQFFWGGIVYV